MTTALSTRDKVTQLNEYLEGKKGSLIKIAPQGTDVDRINVQLCILYFMPNFSCVGDKIPAQIFTGSVS